MPDPASQILEYAPPTDAKRRSLWIRYVATAGALLGIAVVFLPFAYGTSPWDVTFAPIGGKDFDWELALLGVPFLLAFPLFALAVRCLFSDKLHRFELAIGWVFVIVSASATLFFDGIGILDMSRQRTIDGALAVCISVALLIAGGILLLFRGRAILPESKLLVAAYAAYLANAAFCIPGFYRDQNVGWYLAIVVSFQMIFEFIWTAFPRLFPANASA